MKGREGREGREGRGRVSEEGLESQGVRSGFIHSALSEREAPAVQTIHASGQRRATVQHSGTSQENPRVPCRE